MTTTVQIHELTRIKLKEISDKRKKGFKLPNKQTEILTQLINEAHKNEFKKEAPKVKANGLTKLQVIERRYKELGYAIEILEECNNDC